MADTDGGFTVTIECGTGNEYDGRLGLRISSIFVIFVGSLLGAVSPIILARSSRLRVPKVSFFVAKYFGSGVIIATAFIHLLAPAVEALGSPCIPEDNPITQYSWVEGICLMTVFAMFLVELLASRFDIVGGITEGHSHGGIDMAEGKKDNENDPEPGNGSVGSGHGMRAGEMSYPPGGQDHLDHAREHSNKESLAVQMTAIFILEFGVIFHSIFIGLTLAVSGEEFVVLYIVLVFHQTFEGLGLGSRLAVANWPANKAKWLPYLLGGLYAVSTPVSIAAGLGVRQTLEPGSTKTLIVNGVFDSISAGILIYTGLVELMAHEFMFNTEMRKSSIGKTMAAFGCMVLGAGLMALLGNWA